MEELVQSDETVCLRNFVSRMIPLIQASFHIKSVFLKFFKQNAELRVSQGLTRYLLVFSISFVFLSFHNQICPRRNVFLGCKFSSGIRCLIYSKKLTDPHCIP